jgi:alkaline phosphatase
MYKSLAITSLIFFNSLGFTSKVSVEDDENNLFNERKEIKDEQNPRPRNVILMIGDGMGLSQISAGMYMNGNKLNLEQFPVIGLHKSYSGSDLVTDSAAGATAFSCGVKTYNGAIGVDIDTFAVQTILEEAEKNDYATGMVVTSTIVHATPASFVAHQKHREMYEEIAADLVETDIDFFVGGGKKYFDRRNSDDRNLYKELEESDYFVSDYFKQDLVSCQIPKNQNFAYFTADDDPLPYASGRKYLRLASRMAISFLRNQPEHGFFLVIEGSQIDWGGHTNNSDYIVSELIDFDKTIGEVLKFAARDRETLVIVTADHETGGYSILQGSEMGELKTAFTTDYHTADMIPVFAFGPGARLFGGIYENTAIYRKLRRALGFL